VAALPFAPDARFVTWRPDGAGLAELEATAPVAPPPPRKPAMDPAPAPASLAPLDDFFYREDEAAPGPALLGPGPVEDGLLPPVVLDEYLTFRLGGETYGLEIGRVLEVLRTPTITEVPRAPADVVGVITVRGEVVTVVDPRGRLGLARAEGPRASRVVIVDDGEGICGLLIDGVAGVVRLPRGALEPCPQALGGPGGELFLGIGRERDRLFLVLDPRPLLRTLRRSAEARPG
jgi:purine-binding chemotaxis protein CheW